MLLILIAQLSILLGEKRRRRNISLMLDHLTGLVTPKVNALIFSQRIPLRDIKTASFIHFLFLDLVEMAVNVV